MLKGTDIKRELASGLNAKFNDFSVKVEYSSIRVKVKKLISLKAVENVVNKYESIDRCEYTGEILAGGNTFVFCDYEIKEKDLTENFINEIDKAIESINVCDNMPRYHVARAVAKNYIEAIDDKSLTIEDVVSYLRNLYYIGYKKYDNLLSKYPM